jgi:hypothetical protein
MLEQYRHVIGQPHKDRRHLVVPMASDPVHLIEHLGDQQVDDHAGRYGDGPAVSRRKRRISVGCRCRLFSAQAKEEYQELGTAPANGFHHVSLSVADPDPGSGAFLTPGSGI